MVYKVDVKHPDNTVDTYYYETLNVFDGASADPNYKQITLTPMDSGLFFGEVAYNAVNADDPSAPAWNTLNNTKHTKWATIANAVIGAYGESRQ
jgi:hypothetical protein